MARYTYPQFTAAEIGELVAARSDYNTGGLATSRPPFYEGLAGKRLKLVYDGGRKLDYDFLSAHELTWSDGQGNPRAEYYEALSADDSVILLVHTVKGSFPHEAYITTLELDARRVTTFFSKIGNDVSTREVDRDIVFGYIDDEGDSPSTRHELTDELVGKSIIWTYGPGFSIQHIYASKWYSAFVDFNTSYGGLLLSSPCNYVKINDHMYIYSWVETEGAGVQGFALMNLWTLHDVGCFFGINGSSQFECYTFGAVGKMAGQLANLAIPNDMRADMPWPPAMPGEGEVPAKGGESV
ncbi:MAG: molybdenum cofactor biosynthesis F family protein [Oscillospiraceae bacterium]|jgi:hypothetical protein|nr:molybdenum cofactor biosynthesis F family protein [Oscillospiraceae bacterium]